MILGKTVWKWKEKGQLKKRFDFFKVSVEVNIELQVYTEINSFS